MGSPLFEKTTITLENGKQFVIEAKNNTADNVYIQSGKLNGKIYTKNYITYQDIVRGGKLIFEMKAQPNKKRGVNKTDRPYSVSEI